MTPVPPGLDLAFSCDEGLPGPLRTAAGPLADPERAENAWQTHLGRWLGQMLPELPPRLQSGTYSLGLSLVGDEEMAELNAGWRGKEGPTDVLAFAAQDEDLEGAAPVPRPAAPGPGEEEPLELGDIVISLATAARQAAAAGVSLERELTWLASHGLLHLLGWDHPDDARLEAMLRRQDQLLAGSPGSDGGETPGRRR